MKQASLSQYDATAKKIEAQHEELLRKLDELNERIQSVLSEWTQNAQTDENGL